MMSTPDPNPEELQEQEEAYRTELDGWYRTWGQRVLFKYWYTEGKLDAEWRWYAYGSGDSSSMEAEEYANRLAESFKGEMEEDLTGLGPGRHRGPFPKKPLVEVLKAEAERDFRRSIVAHLIVEVGYSKTEADLVWTAFKGLVPKEVAEKVEHKLQMKLGSKNPTYRYLGPGRSLRLVKTGKVLAFPERQSSDALHVKDIEAAIEEASEGDRP